MVRAYVVTGALAALIFTGMTMEASAQSPAPQAQPGWTENGRDVEARIVDGRGDQVLLSDGMKLKLPASVANPMGLQPGEIVQASCEVKDGPAVMTSIEMSAAAPGAQQGAGAPEAA